MEQWRNLSQLAAAIECNFNTQTVHKKFSPTIYMCKDNNVEHAFFSNLGKKNRTWSYIKCHILLLWMDYHNFAKPSFRETIEV